MNRKAQSNDVIVIVVVLAMIFLVWTDDGGQATTQKVVFGDVVKAQGDNPEDTDDGQGSVQETNTDTGAGDGVSQDSTEKVFSTEEQALDFVRSVHNGIEDGLDRLFCDKPGKHEDGSFDSTYCGSPGSRDPNMRKNEVVWTLAWLYYNDPTGKYKGDEQLQEWFWRGGDFMAREGKNGAFDEGELTGSDYMATAAGGSEFARLYRILDEENGFRDEQQKEDWKDTIIKMADNFYSMKDGSCSSPPYSIDCRSGLFQNQLAWMSGFFHNAWVITGDDKYKEYVMQALDQMDADEANGVFIERNGGNKGWDSYGMVTGDALAILMIEIRQDVSPLSKYYGYGELIEENLKEYFIFESYWLTPEGRFPEEPASRTDRNNIKWTYSHFYVSSFVMAKHSPEAARMAEKVRETFSQKHLTNGCIRSFDCSSDYIRAYENYDRGKVSTDKWASEKGDYTFIAEGIKLFVIDSGDTRVFGSFGGTQPNGVAYSCNKNNCKEHNGKSIGNFLQVVKEKSPVEVEFANDNIVVDNDGWQYK